MAELILRLKRDPETGLQELIIDYESDPDALSHEHEREHRAWVRRLIASGEAERLGQKRARSGDREAQAQREKLAER